MKLSISQNKAHKFLVVLFWVSCWQIASMLLPDYLFASPIAVLRSLYTLVKAPFFWISVGNSFGKMAVGFLSAFILGNFLAILSHKFSFIKELFSPIISLVKSIPVASFIIVALIWISSKNVSVLISFFIVFPITYVNMLEGIKNIDHSLIEMSNVFRVSTIKRIKYIYFLQVLPFIISGCSVSLGMCWKAGIAGELIGLPKNSIGEQLYNAKIYLEADNLFAWTIVIVVVSIIFEKSFLYILNLLKRRLEDN